MDRFPVEDLLLQSEPQEHSDRDQTVSDPHHLHAAEQRYDIVAVIESHVIEAYHHQPNQKNNNCFIDLSLPVKMTQHSTGQTCCNSCKAKNVAGHNDFVNIH